MTILPSGFLEFSILPLPLLLSLNTPDRGPSLDPSPMEASCSARGQRGVHPATLSPASAFLGSPPGSPGCCSGPGPAGARRMIGRHQQGQAVAGSLPDTTSPGSRAPHNRMCSWLSGEN
ncbi:hypothetical protein B0T25DRAFT_99906 [Lasiosphaeria hispida]|uniref:Uncharacterized protein n=1 Tax=Lasiosphaeria hispida TaxID=260671 RepID=A0AAJ0HQG2_9PEZI|nr:hypothetical protein B0T25DRAFT_99906 [Lasiosphaeria hispida]